MKRFLLISFLLSFFPSAKAAPTGADYSPGGRFYSPPPVNLRVILGSEFVSETEPNWIPKRARALARRLLHDRNSVMSARLREFLQVQGSSLPEQEGPLEAAFIQMFAEGVYWPNVRANQAISREEFLSALVSSYRWEPASRHCADHLEVRLAKQARDEAWERHPKVKLRRAWNSFEMSLERFRAKWSLY
jgi:hypothetical protein